MKKVFLFALIAVLFAACNKKEEDMVLPEAEVSFSINESINDGLKSATVDDWDGVCATDDDGNILEPAYAEITIDGTPYTPDVYRLDGKLYTQSIKLDATVTTHTVSKFLLYSAGDVLIRATPETGSDYAEYVSKPVSFTFDVNAFEKAEIPIEVLCFMPQNYTLFGFTWFASTEIAVREVCFFGDICLNGEPFAPVDFNGSLYGNNVGVDVPAIMKIIVKRNGQEVPNSPFKNVGALNSPLCVQYPDILNVDGEVFTFDLQLWLPDGNGFSYQTYATYTATDDGALNIAAGVDGIVDFVVGTCGVEGVADQTFEFLWSAPRCVPAELLAGSEAAVSSSTQTLNLAGAEWTISLNADCSVTFCLKPLLFDNWYSLKALTIGIRTEAEAIADAGGINLTYLSSDGSTPDDELVSTDGGVTYCYTAPAGSLPSGEVGIFFMVNGRTPNNSGDLQRFIGIVPMTTPNDWGGFDFSWDNRFKITLP